VSRPSSHAQGRLYELLLGLLRSLSADRPLLLAIEDGHWADQATRDFVAYLARNAARERIALAVTYRSDELGARHPLRTLIAELLRWENVDRVSVERLARADVERLLDHILGRAAGRELVDEVFARSQGNPFFCEELLAAWRAGHLPDLPERVRDVLLVRLEGLDPAALRVVRALSAIGRPAGDELVGTAAGLGEPALSDALRAAVDAHVLVRRADGDLFAFRHALMREVVRADLMPGERKTLHARIAEALRAAGEGRAAELAHHLEAAGERSAALAAHAEAGLQAERVYAWSEALGHHERALALLGDGPPPAGLPLDRLGLLRHAADAARFTGDYDRAVRLGRRALALADPGADPVGAALLHERLGEYTFWDDEAALASYAEALALLPAACEAERARVMGAQALALHYLFRWPEARACAEEALATARRAGARAEEAYARITLGTTLAFLGDPEAGEAHVRGAERIARELGRVEDRLRIASHLGEILRLRGRFAGALAVMEEGEALAARVGMSGSFGRSMGVNAAEDLVRLGRWDEAAARLQEAGRLELRYAAELLHHSVAGQLAVARGDADAARAQLARARAMCDDQVSVDYVVGVHAGWAELALWEGRPRDARAEVAAALDLVGGRRTRCTRPSCAPSGCGRRPTWPPWTGTRARRCAPVPRRWRRGWTGSSPGTPCGWRPWRPRPTARWPRPSARGSRTGRTRTRGRPPRSAGPRSTSPIPPPTRAGATPRRSWPPAGGRTPPRRSRAPGLRPRAWGRSPSSERSSGSPPRRGFPSARAPEAPGTRRRPRRRPLGGPLPGASSA
jgi:tetratricopeptide (TPR) repeat protein